MEAIRLRQLQKQTLPQYYVPKRSFQGDSPSANLSEDRIRSIGEVGDPIWSVRFDTTIDKNWPVFKS